jgi:hypothetical protein
MPIGAVLHLCESAARQLGQAALQPENTLKQQLFGLVLSCGKLAVRQLRSRQPDADSLFTLVLVAHDALMLGVQLSTGDEAAGSSSSSTGSGSGTAAAAQREEAYMSLVLIARGFLLAGQGLEATELGRGITTAEVSKLLCACWHAVFRAGATLHAVELPGGPGSEQVCAAARQRLLQLQGGLQQGLRAITDDFRQSIAAGTAVGNLSSGSSSGSGSGSSTESASEGSTHLFTWPQCLAWCSRWWHLRVPCVHSCRCHSAATTLAVWSCEGRVSYSW